MTNTTDHPVTKKKRKRKIWRTMELRFFATDKDIIKRIDAVEAAGEFKGMYIRRLIREDIARYPVPQVKPYTPKKP